MSQIIAAITGAIIGSLITVIFEHHLKKKEEEREKRETLIKSHLYQLQEALESMCYRIDNLRNRDGRHVMSENYFVNSGLYTLGSSIAAEHLLTQNGVIPKIKRLFPALGNRLKEKPVSKSLTNMGFHKLDRQYLAECVIDSQADTPQVGSYKGFLSTINNDQSESLQKTIGMLDHIYMKINDESINEIVEICQILSKETGVATSIIKFRKDKNKSL